MKKILAIVMTLVMILSVTACGGSGSGTTPPEETPTAEAAKPVEGSESANGLAGQTIEIATTQTGTILDTLKSLVDAFTAETGINVELITPGSDYEAQMKTMMASNELPDIWETHGWSLIRYSEYLEPVNDQPWFDTMDPALEGVMADEDGTYYALALSMSISGIEYNADALTACNIDPTAIRTWDDFDAACEVLKAAGYSPIILGGANSSNCAGMIGTVAPSYLTAEGAKYDMGVALQDGSFDFETYGTEVLEKIADWVQKGYLNEDALTLDNTGAQQLLGSGDGVFMMRAVTNITTAKEYYPDANLGYMPIPTSGEGGKMLVPTGEGDAFGVWKDSEHKEAAFAFLEFMARPENATTYVNSTGYLCSIEGASQENYAVDCYKAGVEAFESVICYDNVFDRKYFPSGMWGIMGDTVGQVIDNPQDVTDAVEFLKTNYLELRAAAGM